jgi:glycosyltransferase involved in cell wall biosynthesis
MDSSLLTSLGQSAEELADRAPLIAVFHHSHVHDVDFDRRDARRLFKRERAGLAAAHQIIVPSAFIAKTLAEKYFLPMERITVAPPGTDQVAMAEPREDGPIRLISVGALIPRKGIDVLIRALSRLRDLDWRLKIIGDDQLNETYVALLHRMIRDLNLEHRIKILGALPTSELTHHYMNSELFVLTSFFEGYGMTFTEAIAHGVPVVGTTAGAVPDTVPLDARKLVPSGRILAIGDTLRDLLSDRAKLVPLRTAALAAAPSLPTWETTARQARAGVLSALERFRVQWAGR